LTELSVLNSKQNQYSSGGEVLRRKETL